MESPPNHDDPLLGSIRSILLAEEQARLRELQAELDNLRRTATLDIEALQNRIRELEGELTTANQAARGTDDLARDLQAEVTVLRRKSQQDAEGVIARVTPVLGDMIGRSIRDSKDEMAEALGPVMGEAIRVQIRDSRKDMVEALYPVIGEAVQRAVNEFAREFQRNIDARLKATFGPQGLLRTASARLRGVSPAELALRDSLPFSIRELFLIQRESGLLLAHYSYSESGATDSDLISGMLTAIRDFVQDSFGQGKSEEELDEIQYGNQRVIIQNGRAAYLAAVINGVEPTGFRAQLRQFVSDLHLKHELALKQYNGDPSTLPNLQPKMSRLVAEATGAPTQRKSLSRNQRWLIAGGALLCVILLAVACFYVQFTVALLPVAFPSRTPTITLTPTSTFTPTPTVTLTPTPTQTSTPTPTYTPTPTRTPTPTYTNTPTPTHTPTFTPTPTQTFTPTYTPTPIEAYLDGHVWVRDFPDINAPREGIIFRQTPVTVLAVYGPWAEVEWFVDGVRYRGWVPLRWVVTRLPIPPEKITPTPTPRRQG